MHNYSVHPSLLSELKILSIFSTSKTHTHTNTPCCRNLYINHHLRNSKSARFIPPSSFKNFLYPIIEPLLYPSLPLLLFSSAEREQRVLFIRYIKAIAEKSVHVSQLDSIRLSTNYYTVTRGMCGLNDIRCGNK